MKSRMTPRVGGVRTMIGVPLFRRAHNQRDGLARRRMRSFAGIREIAAWSPLLADQAVMAIEMAPDH